MAGYVAQQVLLESNRLGQETNLGLRHKTVWRLLTWWSKGRHLKGKNLALLAKWWWRFKTEKHLLWARVVASIYGPEVGLIGSSLQRLIGKSGNWVNIIRAGTNIDSSGKPFTSSFQRTVGDRATILSWSDLWLEAGILSVVYPRLYAMEQDKGCFLKDRVQMLNHTTSCTWNWRRSPRGREVSEFSSLLNWLLHVSLLHQMADSWTLSLAPNDTFLVKNVAAQLDSSSAAITTIPTIRFKTLPLKVNIFLWHARLNFIPCYLNLATRGINVSSIICPLCCAEIESLEHVLLCCSKAFMV